jgi:hypothetical protein
MHLCLFGLSFPNLALCLKPVLTCLAFAAACGPQSVALITQSTIAWCHANVDRFFYTRSASKAEMATNSSLRGQHMLSLMTGLRPSAQVEAGQSCDPPDRATGRECSRLIWLIYVQRLRQPGPRSLPGE